ncbi:MAG: nuclear transport factor 2 family protein [Myxococcales bacterium]|nr:nuclear transport factor 2 family protein [Myxococcales bacterium]
MNRYHQALIEVLTASSTWIRQFNAGEVEACIETYLPNAVMNAAPAGRFVGREAIGEFWRPFVASGASELVYTEIAMTMESEDKVRLSANWQMNVGRGIITNERWIRNNDGLWRLAEDDFEVQEQFATT